MHTYIMLLEHIATKGTHSPFSFERLNGYSTAKKRADMATHVRAAKH